MRVGVVVLNYCNWPDVKVTLASIASQTLKAAAVIVVDNASGDESVRGLSELPGISVLALIENHGYAAGMNAGVANLPSDVDAVLLMTHETILEPGALATLASVMESDAAVGLVGPLIALRDEPGTVWSAGGAHGRSGRPFHLSSGQPVAGVWGSQKAAVDWLDGAALLVRRSALQAVGGLDESWFLYVEERDLADRIRQNGWRVVVEPHATAWQRTGLAPPYLAARNNIMFWRRRRRPGYLMWAVADCVPALLGWAGTQQQRRLAVVTATGLVDGFTGRLHRDAAEVRAPLRQRSASTEASSV